MTSLKAYVAWVQSMYESVPEEWRESAQIEFDTARSYYDTSYVEIEITYTRPETDEEMEQRRINLEERVAAQDAKNRMELRRLKEMYGES